MNSKYAVGLCQVLQKGKFIRNKAEEGEIGVGPRLALVYFGVAHLYLNGGHKNHLSPTTWSTSAFLGLLRILLPVVLVISSGSHIQCFRLVLSHGSHKWTVVLIPHLITTMGSSLLYSSLGCVAASAVMSTLHPNRGIAVFLAAVAIFSLAHHWEALVSHIVPEPYLVPHIPI